MTTCPRCEDEIPDYDVKTSQRMYDGLCHYCYSDLEQQQHKREGKDLERFLLVLFLGPLALVAFILIVLWMT